jgi:hypothetical protein
VINKENAAAKIKMIASNIILIFFGLRFLKIGQKHPYGAGADGPFLASIGRSDIYFFARPDLA